MTLPYDHPSRTMGFYLRFALIVLVVFLPLIILVPTWFYFLDAFSVTLLGVGVISICAVKFLKPLYVLYVIWEDLDVIVPIDSSDEALQPSERVGDAIQQLEMIDFDCLGTLSVPRADADVPIPVWVMLHSDGEIIALATEAHNMLSVDFVTYGADCYLCTSYPRGHRIVTDDTICASVASSIVDAMQYHMSQLDKYSHRLGDIPQILSVQEMLAVDANYTESGRKRLQPQLIDYTLINVLLTWLFTILSGHILTLFELNNYIPMMWHSLGSILMLGAIVALYLFITRRSHGLNMSDNQRKKKVKRGG